MMEKWVEELDELAGHIDEWPDERIIQVAFRLFEANPRYLHGSTKSLWSKELQATMFPMLKAFSPVIHRLISNPGLHWESVG